MAEPRTLTVYIDYKSPYAYLAKDLAYDLERDFPVRLDWLPYVLDIPSFLGSARVDDTGQVLAEAGAATAGFPAYLGGEGLQELGRICRAAEAIGVFGVPSFVLDREL